MEIVIKISEEDYELMKYTTVKSGAKRDGDYMRSLILHGKPLPKGHGRLIDADRLTREEIMPFWYHLPNGDIACPKVDIDHAPTIIEGSDSNDD